MDTTNVPPMKPVLVESVSDDIRTLLQGDVTQQKTILTARAIADLYKCAKFDASNPADAAYFVSGKVDLNKVTVACSRALTKDQYVNGPASCGSFKTVDGYAVDGSNNRIVVDKNTASQQKEFNYSGILYVYSVLGDGSLSWSHYNGSTPVEEGPDQTTLARPLSPMIRQVFWADTDDGTNSNHSPWTRVGTLTGGTYYTWGPWYVAGYRHNGPEYFSSVNITSNTALISSPAVDTVYHIYSKVDLIELPNPNLNMYQNGQKISFMMHPPLTSGGVSMANIHYTEKTVSGTTTSNGEMAVYATPFVAKNTPDIANPRPSDMGVAEYTFEIVDLLDNSGNKVGRTWELISAVEETDYLSGLAQLLEQHAELGSGDLVAYANRKYSGESGAASDAQSPTAVLEVEYTAPVHGFVILNFTKTDTTVDAQWSAVVNIVKEDGTSTTFANIGLGDLTQNVALRKAKFVDKGDVIAITITPGNRSGQGHKFYRDLVEPMVLFYPDAHDGYLHRATLNNKAFTYKQVQDLQNEGSIPLKAGQTVLDDTPVGTKALADAYNYLASRIQGRGLLLGVVKQDSLGYYGLDSLTEDGIYWAKMNPIYDDVLRPNSWPVSNATARNGIHVIVMSNRRAHANLVHDEQFDTSHTDDAQNNFKDKDYVIQTVFNYDGDATAYMRVAELVSGVWTWEEWMPVGISEHDVQTLIDANIKDEHGHYIFAMADHNHYMNNILNPNMEMDLVDANSPVIAANTIATLLVDKYEPVILVGLKNKTNTTGNPDADYIIDVTMPKATAKMTGVDTDKRRKVRFLFYGKMGTGFRNIKFYLHYPSVDGTKTYTYTRVWRPEHTITGQVDSYLNNGSYIQLDFEQLNTPGNDGECVWSPVEIG